MLLPLVLLIAAALAGAVVAYGTHPFWAQYAHGMGLILFARQFQWPLAAVAILACLALVALAASGKRRAWWLIGLGPILALFAHRFSTDPLRAFSIAESVPMVAADKAQTLADDEYVIGLTFNGTAYAYPYRAIYSTPVIFQADREKRMILMWSAFANRAVASSITRELRARDVEIVSMPANALLLYNSKLGQFINGFTGLMPKGGKPSGFVAAIPTEKMRWKQWRSAHPGTLVLAPAQAEDNSAFKGPLQPIFPYRRPAGVQANARVVLVATTQPVVVQAEQVGRKPLNFSAGQTPVLMFRDPQSGLIRAFDRHVDDLVPTFRLNTPAPRARTAAPSDQPPAYLVDKDTNTGWGPDGKSIVTQRGQAQRKLKAIPVEDDVPWDILQIWMPDVKLVQPPPEEIKPTTRPAQPAPRAARPSRRSRSRR